MSLTCESCSGWGRCSNPWHFGWQPSQPWCPLLNSLDDFFLQKSVQESFYSLRFNTISYNIDMSEYVFVVLRLVICALFMATSSAKVFQKVGDLSADPNVGPQV